MCRYQCMQLTESRWTCYGKDRIYVRSADGTDVGYVDLVVATVVAKDASFEPALRECLARWQGMLSAPVDTIEPPSEPVAASPWAPPSIPNVPSEVVLPAPDHADPYGAPTQQAQDLSQNVAGALVRAKRNEVNAQAPVLNLVARVLGVKTEERSWRVGAKGEEHVARELNKLGDAWRLLHAVPIGERGSDIDHVVIGPPGVFTLNTKRHPDGNAWVGERAVLINGQRTDYLRNSRFEGRRASKLLSDDYGYPIEARPVIVFDGLEAFTVKQLPAEVHVTTRRRLVDWLRSLSPTLDVDTVDRIFDHARLTTTWQPNGSIGYEGTVAK